MPLSSSLSVGKSYLVQDVALKSNWHQFNLKQLVGLAQILKVASTANLMKDSLQELKMSSSWLSVICFLVANWNICACWVRVRVILSSPEYFLFVHGVLNQMSIWLVIMNRCTFACLFMSLSSFLSSSSFSNKRDCELPQSQSHSQLEIQQRATTDHLPCRDH